MLSASSARWSAAERPSASEMAASVSGRNTEAAPCLVSEPISSLSNTHSTGTMSRSCAVRKPSVQANTQARSSSRGADTNSPSAPQTVPGWLLYSTRSPATTSSGAQSAVLATSR